MTAGISTILAVPEVQDLVGQHLGYRALETCQFVCRSWRSVFSPLVWQHRPLTLLGSIKHHDDPESRDLLRRYGQHVRRLTVHRVYMLETIGPCLQNITHLQVNQELESCESGQSRWSQLFAFVKCCPRLESLIIYTKLGSRLEQFASALSRAMAGGRGRPRNLTVTTAENQDCSMSDIIALLVGMPALVALDVFVRGEWQVDHGDTLQEPHTSQFGSLRVYDKHERLVAHYLGSRHWALNIQPSASEAGSKSMLYSRVT